MATHGYARWTDIQNDPRFAIINEPFRAMAAKQGKNFLNIYQFYRSFQATSRTCRTASWGVASSFLSRHWWLKNSCDDHHTWICIKTRTTRRWRWRIALHSWRQSRSHIVNCPSAPPGVIRPLRMCCWRYAWVHFPQAFVQFLRQNQFCSVFLTNPYKVLDQIEALLNEMKNDVVRLPTVLARVQPVSNRLGMTERTLLERLRAQNADKSAYPPFNQMPPGPFW